MKVGIFILGKDFYNQDCHLAWDTAKRCAAKRWETGSLEPVPEPDLTILNRHRRRRPEQNTDKVGDCERWAIFYTAYQKMIERDPKLRGCIYVISFDYLVDKPVIIEDKGIMNIHIPWKNQVKMGHLIYKTVEAYRFMRGKFDYYVRSGLSGLIDVRKLKYVMWKQNMPLTKCYSAPLWDAGDWSYGAYSLTSADIVDVMLDDPDPRWYNEGYPDDLAMAWAAWHLNNDVRWGSSLGSDNIWNGHQHNYAPTKTYYNRFGFSGSNDQSTDSVIATLKFIPTELMFFYRANDLVDANYVKLFRFCVGIIGAAVDTIEWLD